MKEGSMPLRLHRRVLTWLENELTWTSDCHRDDLDEEKAEQVIQLDV